MSVPLAPILPDLSVLTDCDKLTAIQDYVSFTSIKESELH